MSFYGNILNRLDKYWNKIKVSNGSLDAPEDGTSELILTSSTDLEITKTNENTINFSVESLSTKLNLESIARETADQTLMDDLSIEVERKDNDVDGYLTYIIKQNNSQYDINIPLDLILSSAEVVEITEDNKSDYDNTNPGVYIQLKFKTEENTQQSVYINVAELNEIAGDATDTITVKVENQKITAKVNDKSITTNQLADNAVTTDKIKDSNITTNKISDEAITTNKITDEAITAEKLSSDIITVENNTLKILQLGKEETK